MQEKLYNLKIKIFESKSINNNFKKELANEILQIEKELAINYSRCCKSDSELLVCDKCGRKDVDSIGVNLYKCIWCRNEFTN